MSKQDLQDQINAINARIADLASSIAALNMAVTAAKAVAAPIKQKAAAAAAKKAGDANA